MTTPQIHNAVNVPLGKTRCMNSQASAIRIIAFNNEVARPPADCQMLD
jgi:hypothetical protein